MKLVVFDLGGTLLIRTENVWRTIHSYFKVPRSLSRKLLHQYLTGQLKYADWVAHDVELWNQHGATRKQLLKAISHIKLMGGTRELMTELKAKGYKLAAISGGLKIALEYAFPDYEEFFDYVVINEIKFDKDGNIIGTQATPFDMDHKVEGLRHICKLENIDFKHTTVVVNSLNDISMAKQAGFVIALNSKSEELSRIADVNLTVTDLRELASHFI